MIGGVCKYFRFTFEYAMYEISYCNLMMLLNTTPVYKKTDDEGKEGGVKNMPDEVDSAADFMKLGLK